MDDMTAQEVEYRARMEARSAQLEGLSAEQWADFRRLYKASGLNPYACGGPEGIELYEITVDDILSRIWEGQS